MDWVLVHRLGLELHPDKTRVVDVRDGHQGFDFLGFHHQKVESWRWRGKRYLQYWPSRRASQRVRARINAITAPRARLREPVRSLVAELNLEIFVPYFLGGLNRVPEWFNSVRSDNKRVAHLAAAVRLSAPGHALAAGVNETGTQLLVVMPFLSSHWKLPYRRQT